MFISAMEWNSDYKFTGDSEADQQLMLAGCMLGVTWTPNPLTNQTWWILLLQRACARRDRIYQIINSFVHIFVLIWKNSLFTCPFLYVWINASFLLWLQWMLWTIWFMDLKKRRESSQWLKGQNLSGSPGPRRLILVNWWCRQK